MTINDSNLIYSNPPSCNSDVCDFNLEGNDSLSFDNGRMQIQNTIDDEFAITPKHKPKDQEYNIF